MQLHRGPGPQQEAEIQAAEARLRDAMIASDVRQLDQLIDDRLVFVGPDGRTYGKQDDLELHRSGAAQIQTLQMEEISVECHGKVAASTVLATIAGSMHGSRFEGRFRYLRFWSHSPSGWRILAGTAFAVCRNDYLGGRRVWG